MPNRKTISNTFVVNSVDDAIHAAVVELSISTILYNANSNGVSIADQTFRIEYALKLGNGESVTISSPSNVSIELPQGVTLSEKRYNSCDIVIANGATISNGVISITLEGVYGNETYSATGTITVSPNKQGIRGVAGRMPYFAGVWESIPNGQEFIVSDTQVPYFEYTLDGQINHALYDGNNSTYKKLAMTPLRGGRPDTFTNGTPWKIMTDDFQYLITKAIFAKFADFGGGIVSGDWVISKYGTLYSEHNHPHTIDEDGHYGEYTINNAYTKFDANNPYSHVENVMNFIPKFALDLRTGRTYQHDTYINGHVVANSGKIGDFEIIPIQDEVNGNYNTLRAKDVVNGNTIRTMYLDARGIRFNNEVNDIKAFEVGVLDNIVAQISAMYGSRTLAPKMLCALQLGATGTAQIVSALDITSGCVTGFSRHVTKYSFSNNQTSVSIVCSLEPESPQQNTLYIKSGGVIICTQSGKAFALPTSPEDGTMYTFCFGQTDNGTSSVQAPSNSINNSSNNQFGDYLSFTKGESVTLVFYDGTWYKM